ncbi:MAG: DHH family phosphoesterase [Oscillospiraceae bacterium]|nr:DHH family phosphoesterase [Oscillospiraceae bacterium]
MKKTLAFKKPIMLLLIAFSLICTCITLISKDLGCMIMTFTAYIACALVWIISTKVYREIEEQFMNLDTLLAPSQKKLLEDFPLPISAINKKGELFWGNALFFENVASSRKVIGSKSEELFPEIDLKAACPYEGWQVEHEKKLYSVITTPALGLPEAYFMFWFNDDKLKRIAKEYLLSRPAVVSIMLDNYTELLETARESERTQIIGTIEYIIENFARETNSLYRKVDKDSHILVMEQRYLTPVLEAKFPLLDDVRQITPDNRMRATLSIGVGMGASNLKAAEQLASQALDMALGRGGDQAAVKTKNGYDFYGGISKGIEKHTKVRTRIIATALEELIQGSSNVIIMGHRLADLDSLGSALGLQGAVTRMGKSAHVVLDSDKNLAKPLYTRFCQNGLKDIFVEPQNALALINNDTLLIIVDTHSPYFLESSEVYAKCKNVVIIDHHRKMVDHIDRAVLFYHEPHASSASEMVAELVQYLGNGRSISNLEAEALLSGIMLDTKNFVLRSGVRTFEAAAYLRRRGADTVEVRKLFSSSMEAYQERSRLVASAEIYSNCAIVIAPEHTADIKVVAAQAADELLTISEVAASFVIYEESQGVSAISARSMGDMNVQIVLEKLGGGGHLTMAGVQLKDVSIEETYRRLLESIDSYQEDNSKTV